MNWLPFYLKYSPHVALLLNFIGAILLINYFAIDLSGLN